MAIRDWTKVAEDGRNYKIIKWTNLGASDEGKPFNVSEYSDKTIHVEGSDLTSGITIQGSCDPDDAATYRTLNDPQGNPLSAITTAKIENVLEHVHFLKPVAGASVSGGTVYLMLASTR